MKKIYLLGLLNFVLVNVNAQQWDWAKHVGRESTNSQNNIIKTNNAGDLFAVGTFLNTATLDDTTFNAGTGNYAARFNASGQRIWAQLIGGQNTAIFHMAIDAANNTYVLGYFANNLQLSDTVVYASQSAFLVAFDQNGARKWLKTYSTIASFGNYLATDGNGDLIYINATPSSNTCTVRKIDPVSGNDIWVSLLSGNFSVTDMKCNSQNEIYFNGVFGGNTLVIDGTTYFQDTGYVNSCFLAKLSAAGTLQDVEVIPGAFTLKFDFDGQDNIYAIGTYSKKMKVRQTTYTADVCNVNFCEEYFMAKLNTSGTTSWARKMHEDNFWQANIDVANNGDFYYSGSFLDSVSFNGVTLTQQITRDAIFIYKFNTNGVAQWAQSDDGGYMTDAFGFDLAYSQSNAVYICGNFHNYYDRSWFGNDTLPYTNIYTHIFLARLTDSQLPSGIASAVTQNNAFSLYPNPGNGAFVLSFAAQPVNATVSVRDILGNKVINSVPLSQMKQEINLGLQPKGIYFVEVITDNKRSVRKLIIE